MSVTITNEALSYLGDLAETLYTQRYFGFRDSAKKYTDNILEYALHVIPIASSKRAPERFKRFGWPLFYITYLPNKTTNWYIFYLKSGNRYLVTYITNNHVNAQHIRGLR